MSDPGEEPAAGASAVSCLPGLLQDHRGAAAEGERVAQNWGDNGQVEVDLTLELLLQILCAKSENARLAVQIDNAKLASDDFRIKYVEPFELGDFQTLVALLWLVHGSVGLMLPGKAHGRGEKDISSLFSMSPNSGYEKKNKLQTHALQLI